VKSSGERRLAESPEGCPGHQRADRISRRAVPAELHENILSKGNSGRNEAGAGRSSRSEVETACSQSSPQGAEGGNSQQKRYEKCGLGPEWRSGMGACGGFSINYRNPKAVAALRKHLDSYLKVSYLKVRPLYTGDYYPLTPHSLDTASWIAWQFHRADLGESVVQAFRRFDSGSETLTVKLRGLDPNQRYEIENLDGGKEVRSGGELMRGFDITLREKPTAAVFVLKAIQ